MSDVCPVALGSGNLQYYNSSKSNGSTSRAAASKRRVSIVGFAFPFSILFIVVLLTPLNSSNSRRL